LRVRKLHTTDVFKEWLSSRDTVIHWLNNNPYLKSDV
jgi:hypothetical protein